MKKLARAMCEAVYEVDKDIIFMGLAGSWMVKAAEETGLKAASEVFATGRTMTMGPWSPESFPALSSRMRSWPSAGWYVW